MGNKNIEPIKVAITDSSENFDTWINRKYISSETRELLKQSDILVVPIEGFRELDFPVFPVKTEEILSFLKKRIPSENKVDICIEDKDYKELALHSVLVMLGGFVVTSICAPILVNILWQYIEKEILTKKEKRNVRVSLTIVNEDGISKNLTYEGNAEDFSTIKDELKKLKQ